MRSVCLTAAAALVFVGVLAVPVEALPEDPPPPPLAYMRSGPPNVFTGPLPDPVSCEMIEDKVVNVFGTVFNNPCIAVAAGYRVTWPAGPIVLP